MREAASLAATSALTSHNFSASRHTNFCVCVWLRYFFRGKCINVLWGKRKMMKNAGKKTTWDKQYSWQGEKLGSKGAWRICLVGLKITAYIFPLAFFLPFKSFTFLKIRGIFLLFNVLPSNGGFTIVHPCLETFPTKTVCFELKQQILVCSWRR